MPKIKQYISQMNTPGAIDTPRANAETFGAGFGRGMEKFGSAVSEVGDVIQKRKEQEEISNLSVETAKAQSELTQKYQEQLKNGTLKAEEFSGMVKERLGGLNETITTRAAQLHLQQTEGRLGAHFKQAAFEGQSQLAGMRAVENKQKAFNERSSNLQRDPHSFGVTLEQSRAELNASVASGEMDIQVATKLQSKIESEYAKNAVRGWLKLNPQDAKAQLDQGQWDQFVDGDMKKQLYGEISVEESARKTQETLNRTNEERIKKEKQEETKTKLLESMVSGTLSTKDIMSSNLEAAQKEHYLNLVETHSTKKMKTDPETYLNLLKRIQSEDGDPKKILDDQELMLAAQNGKLTLTDMNALRGEIAGRKSAEGQMLAASEDRFFASVKQSITISNDAAGIPDPNGNVNFYKFWHEAKQKMKEHKAANKPMQDLFNPDSKDFLGHIAQKYRKDMATIMREQATTVRNIVPTVSPTPRPVPQWKPGQDLREFLKEAKKEGSKE